MNKDNFSVVLEHIGNQPLLTIKTLMQLTGLGLSDAKNLVDSAPITIGSNLNINEAIRLKEKLESIGNLLSIQMQ